MSLVVAIKDKDRFILGADKQVTYGTFRKGHSATKVWEVNDLDNCCMAAVGDGVVNQVLRCSPFIISKDAMISGTIDESYIVNTLVPIIKNILNERGIDTKFTDPNSDKSCLDLNSVFLFAYKDRCWKIDMNGYVTEVEEFEAIGAGEDIALGSLVETTKLNPYERISHCINAASRFNASVDDSIEVVQTINYDGDEKLFYKSLGIDIEKDLKDLMQEEKPKSKKPKSKSTKAKQEKVKEV